MMKTKASILFLSLFGMILGVWAQADMTPRIEFQETTHDFGTLDRGAPTEHTFTFTNTGQSPLRIEAVKAACGCTATESSKQEIAPGEKGFVTATYNAAKPGYFTKTVSVSSNAAEPVIVLTLRGQVQGE